MSDTIAESIRSSLANIRSGWADTEEPMNNGTGGSAQRSRLPGSTIVLRVDTIRTLAFWCGAMLDEWPNILDHIDIDEHGNATITHSQRALNLNDPFDTADFLDEHADRLATWTNGSSNYGATAADELAELATEIRNVSRPPQRDKIHIADCANCGSRILARARTWRRLPNPTTDPDTLPEWDWHADYANPIRCHCGIEKPMSDWMGTHALGRMPADEIVTEVHLRLGMRYNPKTVNVWARRGMVGRHGYAENGATLYDLAEVLTALMKREKEQQTRGA